MSDPELEAIRARRLQQIQAEQAGRSGGANQYGGMVIWRFKF